MVLICVLFETWKPCAMRFGRDRGSALNDVAALLKGCCRGAMWWGGWERRSLAVSRDAVAPSGAVMRTAGTALATPTDTLRGGPLICGQASALEPKDNDVAGFLMASNRVCVYGKQR